MHTALTDEEAHTNDLDAEPNDLKQLVSMGDTVNDTSDDTARAQCQGEDIVVICLPSKCQLKSSPTFLVGIY